MTLFVTLEGPDGGGKSSQAQQLVEHLQGLGYDVLLTREPGGTAIGDQIRRVIMDLANTPMHPRAEILLFSASRAQLCHEVIWPHLQAGGIVVSDRFFDSTYAYQGYGHRLDLDALRHITQFATGGLVPDLTVLLDLPAEDGLMRRKKVEQHQGYLAMAAADPQRWVTVDASRDEAAIQADIRRIVEGRISPAAA